MSTDETLTIQITDQRHPDYQCVFWGVRWTDDPAFVTYHNGSYRERLHVSQFQQITEQEVEPGVYAAMEDIEGLLAREGLRRALAHEGSWCIQVGEALVRVCPANLRPTPAPTPLEVLQGMGDRRCGMCEACGESKEAEAFEERDDDTQVCAACQQREQTQGEEEPLPFEDERWTGRQGGQE